MGKILFGMMMSLCTGARNEAHLPTKSGAMLV